MLSFFLLLVLGLAAGTLSGLIGIGGGIIILPALLYVVGMPQHLAQGTSLAILLPPIGALAVINYYRQGHVDFKVAALICAGFILGAFLGSKTALMMSAKNLKIICGVMFVLIGVKMIITKE